MVSLLDTWSTWRERIIKYARVESANRKEVKSLLSELDELSEVEADDYSGNYAYKAG